MCEVTYRSVSERQFTVFLCMIAVDTYISSLLTRMSFLIRSSMRSLKRSGVIQCSACRASFITLGEHGHCRSMIADFPSFHVRPMRNIYTARVICIGIACCRMGAWKTIASILANSPRRRRFSQTSIARSVLLKTTNNDVDKPVERFHFLPRNKNNMHGKR